jgi:hypothetical protein
MVEGEEGRLPTLDGEPPIPSVHNPTLAYGWADAYARIAEFERTILMRMRELRDRAEPHLQPMIDQTNIAPMEELVATFLARHEAWRERAEALERAGPGG